MPLQLSDFDSIDDLNDFLGRHGWSVPDVTLIVSDREVGVHAKFYLLHPAVPSRATATVELPPQT
jgi:hypothetical protein